MVPDRSQYLLVTMLLCGVLYCAMGVRASTQYVAVGIALIAALGLKGNWHRCRNRTAGPTSSSGEFWVKLIRLPIADVSVGGPIVLMSLPLFANRLCDIGVECPKVAGLSLDQTRMLAIATVASIFWFSGLSQSKQELSSPSGGDKWVDALFFFATTIAFMCWAYDLGFQRVIERVEDGHRFLGFMKAWQEVPLWKHGFVCVSSEGVAYSNFTVLHMLYMYLYTTVGRWVSGAPDFMVLNAIPFLHVGLVGASMWYAMSTLEEASRTRGALYYLVLALGIGVVVAHPSLLYGVGRFNSEIPLPVLPAAALLMCTAVNPTERLNSGAILGAYVACATNPQQGIVLWAAMLLFRMNPRVQAAGADRRQFRKLLGAGAMGILMLLYPRIVIALNGWTNMGSTILFRSGLDGDTAYFRNIYSAVFDPFNVHQRFWAFSTVFYLPLIAAACSFFISRRWPVDTIRRGAFLIVPYAFTAITFGQAVTIHPYGYDYLILSALTQVSVMIFLRRDNWLELDGGMVVIISLILGYFLMSQFLDLAQATRTMALKW